MLNFIITIILVLGGMFYPDTVERNCPLVFVEVGEIVYNWGEPVELMGVVIEPLPGSPEIETGRALLKVNTGEPRLYELGQYTGAGYLIDISPEGIVLDHDDPRWPTCPFSREE